MMKKKQKVNNMPNNAFSDEHEDQTIPLYKNPLSAKIIAVIAIFWLVAGIATIAFGIYSAVTVNSFIPANTGYQVKSTVAYSSLLIILAIAIGCFIISALFFVIYNIACDVHRTEYHLHIIQNSSHRKHKQIIKQFQYIDDSITRQSSIIIRQLSNSKPGNTSKQQRETGAHDGAF